MCCMLPGRHVAGAVSVKAYYKRGIEFSNLISHLNKLHDNLGDALAKPPVREAYARVAKRTFSACVVYPNV